MSSRSADCLAPRGQVEEPKHEFHGRKVLLGQLDRRGYIEPTRNTLPAKSVRAFLTGRFDICIRWCGMTSDLHSREDEWGMADEAQTAFISPSGPRMVLTAPESFASGPAAKMTGTPSTRSTGARPRKEPLESGRYAFKILPKRIQASFSATMAEVANALAKMHAVFQRSSETDVGSVLSADWHMTVRRLPLAPKYLPFELLNSAEASKLTCPKSISTFGRMGCRGAGK